MMDRGRAREALDIQRFKTTTPGNMNNNDLPIAGSKSLETTDKARQRLNNISGALAANSCELRNGIPRRTDIVFACIFALGGGILGTIVFQLSGYAYFYQFFSPETVYWACGQGWVRPAEIPPALLAFLTFQTQSFDCSACREGLARPKSANPDSYSRLLSAHAKPRFDRIAAGQCRVPACHPKAGSAHTIAGSLQRHSRS